MSKTIKIPGRLESAEMGKVVAGANAILDDTKGKKQNVINEETDAELLRLDQEKQGNLTFDQTPTENSTNPVTSGGVYAADQMLSQAIEAILLLIPSAASELNKLVDLATMNSSISTATASFKGTYNLVSDLHLTVSATHAQIAAALDALSLGADNNDYAFVQVPNTDTAPTDIAKTERYKFNGENWAYEYDLNNSGFTTAQWNAINSGITTLLVAKLSALPTNEALTLALAGKQDNLTFDNAPTAGSNNPVKSGGIYTRNNEIVALINALDAAKQNVLTFDTTPTNGSTNPVTSNGVYLAIQLVQTAVVALDGRMGTAETKISTAEGNIVNLQAAYAALTQSDIVVVSGALPSSGQQQNIIYRQPDQDHTPPQFYSDYMWNGTAWVLMATYNNAIDDVPTAGSKNLVESGGVFNGLNRIVNFRYSDLFEFETRQSAITFGYSFMQGHKYRFDNHGSVAVNFSIKYDDGTTLDFQLPAGTNIYKDATKKGSFIACSSSLSGQSCSVVDVDSIYNILKTALQSKKDSKTLGGTYDFNTQSPNTVQVLQNITTFSHGPESQSKDGMVLTLRNFTELYTVGDIGSQIFISYAGEFFYRSYYGSYRPWVQGVSTDMIDVVSELLGQKLKLSYTTGSYVGINTLSQLTLYTGATGWQLSEAFTLHQGERIVLSAQGYNKAVSLLTRFENDTPVECVICLQGTGAYATYTYDVLKTGTYRISGATSPAPVAYLRKDLTVIPKEPINALLKVGVIGDSLASGASDKNGVVSDHYDTSWPKFLARKTNNTYINFTRGGMTAYEWMSESQHGYPVASLPENYCYGYFVALGVNDASRVKKYEEQTPSSDHLYPLGTMSDINDSDYTQNADSFYGWYGRVIQSVMGLVDGCKMFAILIPNEDDGVYYNQINTAITEICQHFGVAVVNLTDFAQFDVFQSLIYKNKVNGHFNAIAYQYISNIIYKAINDVMCNNWDDYMDIQDIVIN